ncbi:MAG TPA: hypothetical protein VEA78_03170 [Acidimicrobiales bacterium]|nr:hypothetical protein [Acidimicrobiales bacterium]
MGETRTAALVELIRGVVARDGGFNEARAAAAAVALHDRATIRSALLELSMQDDADERVEELLAALLGDLADPPS